MALLGEGILISGEATITSDLDETMVLQSVQILNGVNIPGESIITTELDETMLVSNVSLASSRKRNQNIYNPPESVTSGKEIVKTGV